MNNDQNCKLFLKSIKFDERTENEKIILNKKDFDIKDDLSKLYADIDFYSIIMKCKLDDGFTEAAATFAFNKVIYGDCVQNLRSKESFKFFKWYFEFAISEIVNFCCSFNKENPGKPFTLKLYEEKVKNASEYFAIQFKNYAAMAGSLLTSATENDCDNHTIGTDLNLINYNICVPKIKSFATNYSMHFATLASAICHWRKRCLDFKIHKNSKKHNHGGVHLTFQKFKMYANVCIFRFGKVIIEDKDRTKMSKIKFKFLVKNMPLQNGKLEFKDLPKGNQMTIVSNDKHSLLSYYACRIDDELFENWV